ncbi:MAG: hypothetical protein DRO11_08855 [Methanobacteriota archaeon]|nr:MAG: hypothetical protein DRO11_08855 [Euryarchaeota archaeon]
MNEWDEDSEVEEWDDDEDMPSCFGDYVPGSEKCEFRCEWQEECMEASYPPGTFDGLLIEPKGRRLRRLLGWMLRNDIEYYEDREIKIRRVG